MRNQLIELVYQANPWLKNPNYPLVEHDFIPRFQTEKLLLSEWDSIWLVLTGPRQSGKTTLARFLAQSLLSQKRFESVLYLNCDLQDIREWLKTPLFIQEAMDFFDLKKPIIIIDEVQRLENAGLLLKAMADLKLNIKLIATGSSQLELKSKVQEFLTGRHLDVIVLPLSYSELEYMDHQQLIYGCYPAITKSMQKKILLRQIYDSYITKDIIEILRVGKPDAMQKMLTLIAHSSGQLVNYNQLSTDCLVSVPTIQQYLSLLEATYTISKVTPFVGNKRKEITSNPVYYFIDNGFRNQALQDLSEDVFSRQDVGLLIESAIFQEILKFKVQHFYDFKIHFWRTQSGAEVDFVLYKNHKTIIPIEVKYRTMNRATVSRSFRSFVEAYEPKVAFILTKDLNETIRLHECDIHFISFSYLSTFFEKLNTIMA